MTRRAPPHRRNAASLARSASDTAATMVKGAELAMASAQVIAARMAVLGTHSFAPTAETATEMALMAPEKVEAFANAGVSMAGHLGGMAAEGAKAVARESLIAAEACADIASARSPMDFALAQSRYVAGWFGRATTDYIAMAALTTKLQADALAPIHKTATANAKRLKT
jgi:hypothetical protein